MFHTADIQAETRVTLDVSEPVTSQGRPPRRRALWLGLASAAIAASFGVAWFAARPVCGCVLPPIEGGNILKNGETHAAIARLRARWPSP